MQERYIRWWTPHLSRDFEMLAFGGGGGLPLVLFPTSFGRYYPNKDFGLIDAVAWFIETGRATVYCPDAIDLDSFDNKSIHPADRMRTHLAYENVIVRDVSISRGASAQLTALRSAARVWAHIMPQTSRSNTPMR